MTRSGGAPPRPSRSGISGIHGIFVSPITPSEMHADPTVCVFSSSRRISNAASTLPILGLKPPAPPIFSGWRTCGGISAMRGPRR